MNVAVVVPRRADWWRDQLWAYARPHLEAVGYPILEIDDDRPGYFNRSWCLNRGAEAAGDWDVLVAADSDVIVDPAVLRRAVSWASATGRYTVAGNARYGVAQRGTTRLLMGWPLERWPELRLEPCRLEGHRPECRIATHDFNSHAVAIRRDLWDLVGGFDERFIGWGHEDGAFLAACETWRPGVERIRGDLLHLWHERAPERSRIDPIYGKNKALRARYTEAKGDPVAMRRLLDERKEAPVSGGLEVGAG